MPFKSPDVQRAYQREWVARRRRAFFADKTCRWCDSVDELELHHRDPDKKVAHAIWSWTERRRLEEIAKCDILCRACHDKAHAEAARIEAALRNPHGTVARYKTSKCRCEACRAANAEYDRAWRLANANGGGGIRTREAPLDAQPLSRRLLSATQAPLHESCK